MESTDEVKQKDVQEWKTSAEAANHIHSQYRNAIKSLCGLTPFGDGDNTIRLLTECIQSVVDSALASLRAQHAQEIASRNGDISQLVADKVKLRSQHEREMEEMQKALRKAKEIISIWHGEVAWPQYQHSPEMKIINAALAQPESKQ